ncbi:hypothetical protein BJ944DRAFT_232155 [Cunninghamella echinulata]|nr:hypothetical protein BJ944DRAFT_232155 [Cunninghamella echinulata]
MEETQGSRVQPRRSSRSTLSNSPTVKEEKNVSATESNTGADTTNDTTTTLTDTNDTTIENNDNDNNTSNNQTNHTNSNSNNNNSSNTNSNSNTNNHSRVTRSLSTDSNSNEESSNSNPPSNNGKRRRNTNHTKQANKKKPNTNTTTTTTNSSSPSSTGAAKSPPRGSGDDFERETRNTTHRLSKEAKDARKAERDIIIKKKLAELDTLERTVKDQSHEEYHKLLEEIQSKRNKKLTVAQGRHALMETNFKNGFLAQKKSAYDKFHLDKLALRRTMMNQIQQKINRIEQEYFSSQQGLDEQEINQDFTDLNEQGTMEDCHPLERTKKDSLPLMSST